LRIRDVHPGSQIRISSIPSIPNPNFFHPGSRNRVKELKYINPKKWFLSSPKCDPCCSSRIWILIFYSSRIPGSKRHRIHSSRIRITIRSIIKEMESYKVQGTLLARLLKRDTQRTHSAVQGPWLLWCRGATHPGSAAGVLSVLRPPPPLVARSGNRSRCRIRP
jgi:hypothetical protein